MSAPRQRVATLAARIHAVIRRPFAATPIDILTDRRITLADRTILAYMLARAAQPGWTLYVGERSPSSTQAECGELGRLLQSTYRAMAGYECLPG